MQIFNIPLLYLSVYPYILIGANSVAEPFPIIEVPTALSSTSESEQIYVVSTGYMHHMWSTLDETIFCNVMIPPDTEAMISIMEATCSEDYAGKCPYWIVSGRSKLLARKGWNLSKREGVLLQYLTESEHWRSMSLSIQKDTDTLTSQDEHIQTRFWITLKGSY